MRYCVCLWAMKTQFTPDPGLGLALKSAGSIARLARLLGLSVSTVHSWLRRDQALPAQHVLTAEEATGVSRHDLRPDLYPREDGPAQPSAASSHSPSSAADGSSSVEEVRA